MRSSINFISHIKVSGEWVTEQEKIRDSIEDFYRRLYSEPFLDHTEIKAVDFDCILEEHREWLERPFMKEEVKMTLNSMEDDKASEPDGFPIKFLKVCWEVIGREAFAALEAFQAHDQWCRSLNATFITLVPKKEGAAVIKDYRPISLVGCLYKLLAKTLAVCLKVII